MLAFLVTLIEMTEVVILVFALSAERSTLRTAAIGAAAGSALVGGIAAVAGGALSTIPSPALLAASALVLWAFAVFLFRSTLRTYRWSHQPTDDPSGDRGAAPAHFAGGFSVGAVETTEAAVVLVPLAAGGQALAALLGAVAAGVTLAVAVGLVHEKIRRIKTPWLKLGATSLLVAFATLWTGEALGVAWPFGDLFLLPLFALALVLVRTGIEVSLRVTPTARPT